jgi:ribonuclease P protein component
VTRPEALPRQARLKHTSEFRHVYDHGRPERGRNVVLLVHRLDPPAIARAGVVASRKVGDAVRRNRAKRLMREAFRKVRGEINAPAHLVLVATRSCPKASAPDVAAELRTLLHRAGLLP